MAIALYGAELRGQLYFAVQCRTNPKHLEIRQSYSPLAEALPSVAALGANFVAAGGGAGRTKGT
uniref:Uncharacterized protein n=1 Tax=Romanomermis culicivorax TaxID=13658 RepID=A0A915JPP0_ROMCU